MTAPALRERIELLFKVEIHLHSVAEHPIRRFFDRGLMVSVNTDDPRMFQTSLTEEYLAIAEEPDFTLDEIRELVRRAIDSTWAEETTKQRLRRELEA